MQLSPTQDTDDRSTPPAPALRVVCSRRGSLAALATAEEARPPALAPGEVEIEVRAAGLNFMDVLGVLDRDAPGVGLLGVECAGTVTRVGPGVAGLGAGDPVAAIAPGSFATHVVAPADLVAPMPSSLDFAQAATIPIAFLTADFALRHEAGLRAGERVLIHSAAGGVGLAAVQIAERIGAEIVATAGNEEKRALLRARGIRHVLDSRAPRFADEVRALTGGEGVDVVLNSLAGDAIAEGLAALRPYGRFVEIGKADIRRNAPLPLGTFTNCLRYVAVDLQRMCLDRRDLVRTLLLDLLERFRTGDLRPLPHREFAFRDAEAAFRHLTQRKNVGKVVLVPEAAAPAAGAEPTAAAAADDAEPSPAARVGEGVQRQVAKLTALYGLDRYEHFGRDVDRAASALVRDAFARLGWTPRVGERVERTALMERLGIQPAFGRLVERALGMLVEDGVLAAEGDALVVRAPAEGEDGAAELRRLEATYPVFDAELALLARCGSRLADVLAGRADPVEVLFPGGRLDALEALYQDSPLARFFNSLAASAVGEAVGRGAGALRVLEVGAGTGSTTASILPRLPGGSEYVYTDVSKLFTRHGRRKFENYRNVRYELLDVEADPAAQGFEPGSFDLVVAANVLHATADLRRSLAHVRKLLRPGGWLVLLELTRPSRWLDLVFGLLQGWRKFQDGRSETPILDADAWCALLAEAGFPDAVALPRPGDRDPGQALVVARRDEVVDAAADTRARDLGQWLYELRWEPKKHPDVWGRDETALPMRAGRWLVFDDGTGVGREVAARLDAQGGRCVLVRPSADAEPRLDLARGCASVAPTERQAMRELVAQVAQAGGPPLRGVIYLWSLAAPPAEDTTPETLDEAQALGTVGVLHLVDALAGLRWTEPPRLWLATRGAQVVGTAPTPVAIAQAPLWGLGRVVALEHPELRCVRVDLDPRAPADEARSLLDEIRFEEYEDQVAFRDGERWVLRLVRAARDALVATTGADRSGNGNGHGNGAAHGRVPVHADATYLVTGGLGGLGLVVAEWLATRGARHLVLVGRRGPTEAARLALERIAATGAHVEVVAADVTRERDVGDLIARIAREMPPLRGVVHAAGVLDDAVLLELDERRLRAVMAPKARGAWNLHRATAGARLDFFALFSSMASVLGTLGQGNYAAANAFMDALAQYRRTRDLTAISIDWGPWSEVGLAAGEARGRWLAAGGVEPISPSDGRTALEVLLPSSLAQVGVLSVNWRQWRQLNPGPSESPALAELMTDEAVILPKMAGDRPEGRLSRKALLAAAPAERRGMLETYLRELAASAFELPVSEIDPRIPLASLGLESLMAVEVRNQIESDLAVSVSMVDFVEGPSIADIAGRLLDQIIAEGSGRPSAPARPTDGEWEEFTL